MLHKFKKAALISLVSLLLCSSVHSQNDSSTTDNAIDMESEATSVVLSYLDALGQGDTITIKDLLGGQYLGSRSTVLDNPNYSNTLIKIYSNANSEIIGTEVIDQKNIAVDTKITLSPDEILQRRYIISRGEDQQLKIVAEQEHSN